MKKESSMAPRGRLVPNPKARLREQFHEVARFRQFSLRTEESYWDWVKRFLVWVRRRNLGLAATASPEAMGDWQGT
jgi:hypothetical protein